MLTNKNDSTNDVPKWLKDGNTILNKDVILPNIRVTTPIGKIELISGCKLHLISGHKYGLIGKNGIGKTTLLNMISKYEFEDFPSQLRVIHITQESDMKNIEQCPLDIVKNSNEEHSYLLAQEEKLLNELENDEDKNQDQDENKIKIINNELNKIYERLESIGYNQFETKAYKILEGLQFTKEMIKTSAKNLSGGWRMRIALACALFCTPDILLLDEPTNHLDFPAVIWLEKYLNKCEHTVVIVSHDRMFLDNIITNVIEFRDKTLYYYKGNFTSYEKARNNELNNLQNIFNKQQHYINSLKEFVEKNAHNEHNSQMYKQKKIELEKAQSIAIALSVENISIKIQFPDQKPLDHKLIEIIDMNFGYESNNNTILLQNVNLVFDVGDRVGILGANGTGKSTLIKLILGQLMPISGKCRLNPAAKVALFTQHHCDQLNMEVTPFEYLQELFPETKDGTIRGFLCGFGLDINAVINQKIKFLSGGQKSRVAFAILNWTRPHCIIMDEPTNHLDMETIDTLVEALHSFKGGLIVISHDQYFLSKVCINDNNEQTFWAINSTGNISVLYDLNDAKSFSYNQNIKIAKLNIKL